jgi:beta-lactamase superfamily II metal-dependent hydrolase
MFELDYMWVGEGEKTGDAIACRLTRPDMGTTATLVIDGGFPETGDRMVEHIRAFYDTNYVDLAVCTHLDDDHVRGLFRVVEQLEVGILLIHQPSLYGYGPTDDVKADLADDLADLALSRGTTVVAPRTGQQYFGGAVTVLGPSEEYYKELLEQEAVYDTTSRRAMRMLAKAARGARRAFRSLTSDPGETLIDDNGGTTPRNNTSVILNVAAAGGRALFTGDAGVPALQAAADYLDSTGLSRTPVNVFDVPHHGSRHNVDPHVLDRLLGPITTASRGCAIASVGTQADEHPRPEVANAIRRRGYPVWCTRGTNVWWQIGAPGRAGYSSLDPLPWLDESER